MARAPPHTAAKQLLSDKMRVELLVFFLSLLLPLAYTAIVGRCSKDRKSNRCTGSNAFWQYDGICLDDTNPPTCHVPDSRHFRFYLVAAVQRLRDSLGEPPIKDMWVRGAGPGLSWETAVKMKKVKEGHWILLIEYISDSNALLCQEESRCSLNQQALEVRFYRDEHGMDNMLGPNMYIHLPVSNSIAGHAHFSPPDVFLYPWFDGKRVLRFNIRLDNPMQITVSDGFRARGIPLTIYYPPSFEHNLLKRYPLVIVIGRKLEHQIIPLLESMYLHESNIEEAFVLGMHSYSPTPYCKSNPFEVLDTSDYMGNILYRCPEHRRDLYEQCMECMSCLDTERVDKCSIQEFDKERQECEMLSHRCEPRAEYILDNIQDVVIPEISVRTMNRIKVDYPKDKISILGIDGAGLMACYAALSRPDVYQNAACFSAPFHWPLRSATIKESRKEQGIGLLFNEIMDKMKLRPELQVLHATQKYWIDVGEYDNDFLPIVDEHNYSDWVVDQMKARLKIDNIVYFRNVLGAGNSYIHMRPTHLKGIASFIQKASDIRLVDRLKLPLQWFLKPEGGFNAKHPRTPALLNEDFLRRKDEVTGLADLSGPAVLSSNDDTKDKSCKDILVKKQAKTVTVATYLISIGTLL